MKKNKSLVTGILLFLFFWWHPFFYFGLIIYLIIKFRKKANTTSSVNTSINKVATPSTNNLVLKCTKCGNELTINHKFCTKCGEPFDGNNVKVEISETSQSVTSQKAFVLPSQFDSMFSLNENQMVEEFINRELVKAEIDKNSKLIPSDILKKKKIFNIIFSLLIFIYIVLIFFHFPLLTYIIGLIILFIFFKLTRGYNLMKYLKKQLKARPSEKVSNIVMSVKTTSVVDTSKKILLPGIIGAIILPMIIFIKPVILYEKMDNGYGVRYYIFGLTNFTKATIPEKHNNENVISLRGNTFSNMPFLSEVTLPDTITEIRGQAFKNNRSLTTIKLPSKLNYLGGGAFYNCTSLESIEIPDTVTYIGGEAFYNAKSLKSVKLSNNITEIRGSTFENCSSLESIVIPDSVTRIGGHAFYGNSSLSSVSISENSKLTEIGSSAFRQCSKLYEITIPVGVYVNSRAFKESPTDVRNYGMVDKNIYEHNTFIYLKIGESRKINDYYSNAQIQNSYIKLVDIVSNNNSYEFILLYTDANTEKTITLTKQHSNETINDNLVVEIENDYVFDYYNDKVSLYAYYN